MITTWIPTYCIIWNSPTYIVDHNFTLLLLLEAHSLVEAHQSLLASIIIIIKLKKTDKLPWHFEWNGCNNIHFVGLLSSFRKHYKISNSASTNLYWLMVSRIYYTAHCMDCLVLFGAWFKKISRGSIKLRDWHPSLCLI